MIAALIAAAVASTPAPAAPPPELPVSVYKARRARVLAELGGCSAVIGAQGDPVGLTSDFRQDGDFFWLTGVNEPHAWLLFSPRAKYQKVTLYLKPRDPEAERWTGPREPLSPDLQEKYGVDQIRRGKPGGALLAASALGDCVAILAPPSAAALAEGQEGRDRADADLARKAATSLGLRTVFKRGLLARLRAAHDAEELARMERALQITRSGQEAAARASLSGVSERHVQTQVESAFFNHGATGLSYATIVGSGENGAVLHWDQNSRVLREGDLVVVDAGAEYGRYASDITRTFPVSGRFNEEQAKAYRAVYQAQEDIFAAIKPGASMSDLQRAAEDSLRKAGYLKYFIHGFGHTVGLDVHDVGDHEAALPVGAVVTVEPGVYLPERGFGVRIEDEILVTPTGYRLLSKDLPRKLEDVEAWVRYLRRPR
ncbi:MAG: aminopeptidase P N-terminal domain-containing protein [Myxococcales bacterium]